MGWLFKSGYDKSMLIKDLIKGEENEQQARRTRVHCVRGNVLWSVIEITHKQEHRTERFIACHLLASEKGYGWGYKDMCESMHPLYYSCPLKYLEMVPEVANESWRELVRHYHQRRNVQVGQRVKVVGSSIPWVNIISRSPLIGEHNGVSYRVPSRMLGGLM